MAFRLTDYAENKVADMHRGIGLATSLPGGWYFAIGSDATDSSFTELSGTGYTRPLLARTLVNFAGTQGAGTSLASNGTSHTTSNNTLIDWGTAGAAWGAANFIGLFDASSSGNCWIYLPVPTPVTIGNGTAFSLLPGELAFSVGLTGGMTNYLANKVIDLMMRGQAFTYPATTYARLFTALPTNAGGGSEVVGASYSRVAVNSSTSAWSGTQGATTTTASSGVGGRISNNAAIIFASAPGGEDWGDVVGAGLQDASSGGNLLYWSPFTTGTQSIIGGTSAPTFGADKFGITFD